MNSAIERLLTLRIRDIMSEDVVCIDEDATMGQAATVLEKNDITGAPVVDSAGKCVGVLSVTDFVHRDTEFEAASKCFGIGFENTKEPSSDTSAYFDPIKNEKVQEHMSPLVQTISQDAPIMNAARVLLGEHIHRLLVVDEDQYPIGVVTSLDLIACMVAAVDE